MMKQKLVRALVALMFVVPVVLVASAEDLSGKWGGSFNISRNGGEPMPDVVHMVLKHTEKEVTGTVGPNEQQQWPISKAKVDGVKLSFEVAPEGEGGPKLVFALALEKGHLKGQAKADVNGESLLATIDMERLK